MKKAILICLLSLMVKAGFTQKTEWLFGLSPDSAQLLATDIAGMQQAGYSFEKQENYTTNFGIHVFAFTFKSEQVKEPFDVYFQAFQIDGKPRLFLEQIEGDFDAMFSFWSKYIDGKANPEEAKKKRFNKRSHQNPIRKEKWVSCILSGDRKVWSVLVRVE
ncbi:MAG TPA: hypothetical protein PKE30_16765 [Niabella sp.]|nr:hypothetical protein [Niabella sp.]